MAERSPGFLAVMLRTRGRRAFAALVVAAVAAAVLIVVNTEPPGKRVTAYFGGAVGVYPGSDVRVLGVKTGQIDEVKPEGDRVRVTLTIDHDVKVPAGAKAAVVAPSVVADRYVQFTPVYTGGAELLSGAVLGVERTATPAELDQVYDALRRLTDALGPKGVNQKGALSKFIETSDRNLTGNGEAINDMVSDFGKAARTLNGSSDDLFGTVRNLGSFTSMLRSNDRQVRKAISQLSEVNSFLAADRDELAAGLHNLAIALRQVKTFIRNNRARLKSNVDKLASITQTLVDQRKSLAEALDVTPLIAGNLLNAYDPETQTIVGRGNLVEITAAFGKGTPAKTGKSAKPAAAKTVPGDAICGTAASRSATLDRLCELKRSGELRPGEETGVTLPFPPVGPVYGGKEKP